MSEQAITQMMQSMWNDMLDYRKKLDARLDKLDKLDKLDARFDHIDKRFVELTGDVATSFKLVNARIDQLIATTESNFKKVKAQFARIDAQLSRLEASVNRLEATATLHGLM